MVSRPLRTVWFWPVGHWLGHWKDAGAQRYVQRVDRYLDSRPWLDWTSEHH